MADLNMWSVTGRLTQDANYRVLASGKALLSCGIAVNTGWGEYKKTTFATINQWGEKGAKLCPYLTKGKLVAVSGTLSLNTWQGRDGKDRSELIIDTNSIQLLSVGDEGASKQKASPPPEAEEDIDAVPF